MSTLCLSVHCLYPEPGLGCGGGEGGGGTSVPARASPGPAGGPCPADEASAPTVDQIGRRVLTASSNQEPCASRGSFIIDHRGEAACVLRLSPAVGFVLIAARTEANFCAAVNASCGSEDRESIPLSSWVSDNRTISCRHACHPQGPRKWTVVSGNVNQKPGQMTVIGKAVNLILACLLLKIRKFFSV